MSEAIATELQTLRDYWRYAISRFNAAQLSFGHGTETAGDDAAFLLLDSLDLPIDTLEPFLDARLLQEERRLLAERIEARVTTRKPSAYLTGRAYIQGLRFAVDERVIVPRSLIGEILYEEYGGDAGPALLPDPSALEAVAEICTGSGCLAIIAAGLLPWAKVDAVDLSPDALEVAKVNVAAHDVGDRLSLHQGDLYGPLEGRKYDLIITNPPYVGQTAMDALPEEYRFEPRVAFFGGEDGLDLVRTLITEAPRHLNPGGGILCEIGTGREILEEEFPDLAFVWLETAGTQDAVFWLPSEAFGIFVEDEEFGDDLI
jgi:ribosomal protein L3 glutamine methyltransferase